MSLAKGRVLSHSELLRGEALFYGFAFLFSQAFLGLRDLVPLADHFFEALGMFFGEVVELGAIIGEIVKFPLAEFGGSDFPVAGAEGAVVAEVKVEWVVGLAFLSFENGEK